MITVPADVTVLFGRENTWILYNVRTRTCVAVELDGLKRIRDLIRGDDGDGKDLSTWDIHRFSNEDGLLCDPTRMLRGADGWPEPQSRTPDDFREHLLKMCIVVTDDAGYRDRFRPKTSILDFDHFGNFHQQLGQHFLTVKRTDPVGWWYRQKFTDDLSGIRNNLYRSVQEAYLKEYFPRKLGDGIRIADIGCGIGYYSRMMASLGAEVLALDTNADYIEKAASGALANLTFKVAAIGTPGGLDDVPSGSLDFIFMSDALLFYFIPESPKQHADPAVLMEDFYRILKPGGTFISLEPHASFFLAPWFGATDCPYTVLTEYRNREFNIIPPLSVTLNTIMRYGFCVSFMDELYSQPLEGIDERAHGFAREFPVWQLIEFKKNG